jgi:L-fucose isomerase-like protein
MRQRPKLGVITIAKKNHYKGEIIKLIEIWKERLSKEQWLDVEIEPTVLYDETAVWERARKMEYEGVDLIVLVIGTWVYSSVAITTANDLHTPFILYGLSDRIANGNIGASAQIHYVLQEMGKKFLYLTGPTLDEENMTAILKSVKAASVKRQLRNKKIATIGGKPMLMYQTQVNEFDWKSVFGVDFPHYDVVQVFAEMTKVDEIEAKKVADDFLSKVKEVHWQLDNGEKIYDDAVVNQAKMFLAFKRLQKMYGIDVFANKCHPEMVNTEYGCGYAGCVATCMLNDAGITTACEADVPAALSMYILYLFTGRPAFFADIARLDKVAKLITFFNCGTAPSSMADPAKGVTLWPIPKLIADEAVADEYFGRVTKGATVKFELEPDKEVTVLRIGGNGATLRFHVAPGTTCEREVDPEEVLGQRWPGFALKLHGDTDKFLRNSVGHHYSLAFGALSAELGYLANMLGVQCVVDS